MKLQVMGMRRTASSLLLLVILVLDLILEKHQVLSFFVRPSQVIAPQFPIRQRQHSISSSLPTKFLHRLYVSIGNNDNSSNDGKQQWTMEEDWALVDQVPHFTVGGIEDTSNGNNEGYGMNQKCHTFWTQLSAATPLLSHRTEFELLERCQKLSKQEEEEEGSTKTTKKKNRKSLLFGPSPQILHHWSIDSSSIESGNRISGQTEDGRTIWMTYHLIGRLKGDPLSSSSVGAGAVCNMLPGGYVEAIGGRVYELGQPAKQQQQHHEPLTSKEATIVSKALINAGFVSAAPDDDSTTNNKKNSKTWDGWIAASTASMSALLASTVLSACIGYGAGLSIIHDGSQSHHALHSANAATLPSQSSSSSSYQGIMYPSTTTSVTEQRARTEARVLRERRVIKAISDRLEKDQEELQILRQQERTEYINTRLQQP